ANGGAGVLIEALGTAAITASIDRVTFYNNNAGVNVLGMFGTGAITVTVTDSASAHNGFGYIVQSSIAHSVSNLLLPRSTAVGNGSGVQVGGTNATIWMTQSTVAGNTVGYNAAGPGVINSYGDNSIDANGGNVGFLSGAMHQ